MLIDVLLQIKKFIYLTKQIVVLQLWKQQPKQKIFLFYIAQKIL